MRFQVTIVVNHTAGELDGDKMLDALDDKIGGELVWDTGAAEIDSVEIERVPERESVVESPEELRELMRRVHGDA